MRQQYKNKVKIIDPTWSDEFEMSDSFCYVSYIQDYIYWVYHKNMKQQPLILLFIFLSTGSIID